MIRQTLNYMVENRCLGPLQDSLGSRRFRGVFFIVTLLTTLLRFNGMVARETAPSGKPEYSFPLSEDEWPQCVAFSPDGRKVYAGTNVGYLWIWELKAKPTVKRIRLTSGGLLTGPVLSIAISPDGHRALAGCADSGIRIVDLDKSEVTHVLRGHDHPVFCVIFDRDGQRALSGSSGDKTIIQWDMKTNKSIRRYKGNERPDSLSISLDGRRFLATEFKSFQEWDLRSGKRLRCLTGHEYRIYAVFYSPDGKTIISGGYDNVRVWDATTGKCLRSAGNGKITAHHFALSPDGRRILLGRDKEMLLLDLQEGKELKRWTGLAGSVHVAFSPDGRYALSGEEQGPVSVWLLPKERE